ncbi:MAG: NAD(P)/FAD-dependent oxidoreductase [Holophagae bacterium]
MSDAGVVIVGAGLAGLSCAIELERAGLVCTVIERDDRVGGRVQTDIADGFRLDRGFQVLLTAYPETQRLLDYDALQLRPFFPGAVIVRRGRRRTLADPWRRPLTGIAATATGTVAIADGLRMARFRSRVRSREPRRESGGPERTTLERLRAEGFSDRIIDSFFRPFFGGVFLDAELRTSERQLEFIFKMFSAGDIAVPALGMGEITRQLAAALEQTELRSGVTVEAVAPDGVHLAGGERLVADAVVVATDADSAVRLVDGIAPIEWRGVTCLYFAADQPPLTGPKLVLNGDDGAGPVNNLVVMSEVAPDTAPDGRALISVTVVGTPNHATLEADVRRQLEGWFGAPVSRWRHLRTYAIERALPDQRPPRPDRPSPRLGRGLYVCGDHRADGSINGAMASGRDAARAVIDDLRGPAS